MLGQKSKASKAIELIVILIIAILFTFPLYWIITGAFKTVKEVNSTTPVWWPYEWTMDNWTKLMGKLKAPLFEINIPFSQYWSADGNPIVGISGATVPAAIRWMINTVWMAVAAMLLTCITSALAGYSLAKKRFVGRNLIFTLIVCAMALPKTCITSALAGYSLAKKRFVGRNLIFTLIVCAMALPKQVILIPLIREMSALKLYNTLSAVIFPIVGWPFGVFLIKQFAESIPGEILEAARIDGAGELKTFTTVVWHMIKPGVGALAIFTFIQSWNDYFMQLIMLSSTKNLTISLGIAKMQAENSTDYGLIMAGAAFASVPIIIVFIIFQKYFTKGITMGAVKG